MDLQRTADQGEAKVQQNPQPQAPPTAPGGAEGAPVGLVVRFRIASASRALPVHAGLGACELLFHRGRMPTTRSRLYLAATSVPGFPPAGWQEEGWNRTNGGVINGGVS